MIGCVRTGYALTCCECWPNNQARWCDSCFDRFGDKPEKPKVTSFREAIG